MGRGSADGIVPAVVDVVVRHMALVRRAPLTVFEIGVFVGGFVWMGGDDVPGVQEAGDEAEAAEEDVDEGVGAADAGFDPD